MKRKIIIILIVLLILAVALFIFYKFSGYSSKLDKENEIINNRSYVEIIPDNYEDIDNYIKKENKSIIIIGKSNCHYCELFLPIVREASKRYKFEYMYVDINKLDEKNFKSLMFSDIKIPSKCSSTGEAKELHDGFGTPLTLFYEMGNVYDCIRGYVGEEALNSALKGTGFME